jgi:hypothetical protein
MPIRFRSYIPVPQSAEESQSNSTTIQFSNVSQSHVLRVPAYCELDQSNELFSTFFFVQQSNQHSHLYPALRSTNLEINELDQDSNIFTHGNIFIPDSAFQRLMNKFRSTYDKYFPDTPCAFCRILMLPCQVMWMKKSDSISYRVQNIFGYPLANRMKRTLQQVAVCTHCKSSPRSSPSAGPWPDLLTSLSQCSRMFLSPVPLQTSLGRTQSHSHTLNPYSTYRTVTGKLFRSLPS